MAPDEDESLILIFVKKFELNIRDVCEKIRCQIAEMRARRRRRECQARSERWAAGRLHRRRGGHWAPANNAGEGTPSYGEGYCCSPHALSIPTRTRARSSGSSISLSFSSHSSDSFPSTSIGKAFSNSRYIDGWGRIIKLFPSRYRPQSRALTVGKV